MRPQLTIQREQPAEMLGGGVEPPREYKFPQDPESCASASSATRAPLLFPASAPFLGPGADSFVPETKRPRPGTRADADHTC